MHRINKRLIHLVEEKTSKRCNGINTHSQVGLCTGCIPYPRGNICKEAGNTYCLCHRENIFFKETAHQSGFELAIIDSINPNLSDETISFCDC